MRGDSPGWPPIARQYALRIAGVGLHP